MALSNKAIEKLGHRLRVAETPAPSDVALLGELLIGHDRALADVAAGLRSIGLAPTTRLKSTGTIVDKLKRERTCNLRAMQDLAGARVVKRMSLDEQDAIASQILGLWDRTEFTDRRLSPSFGYRAVHLITRVDGCRVEIQLRTVFQDIWAQGMEMFGDVWGRQIRYGGDPDTPDAIAGHGQTRAQVVSAWVDLGDALHLLALRENELAGYDARGQGDHERATELRRVIQEDLQPVRKVVSGLAGTFGHGGTGTGMVDS